MSMPWWTAALSRTSASSRRARRWRALAAAFVVAANGASTSREAAAQGAGAVALQACADLPDTAALLAELNMRRGLDVDCGETGHFGAAAPLHWDDRLARTAADQATAVALRRELSHHIDGADLGTRLQAATYQPAHAAENLAAGPATLSAAVSRWMASAPHCANLMAPHLRDAGVGCAIANDADGTPMHYWALVLGEPRLLRGARQTISSSR